MMSDFVDQYLKLQLGLGAAFERLRDPYGLGALANETRRIRDLYGLGSIEHGLAKVTQLRDLYGLGSIEHALMKVPRVPGLAQLDEVFARHGALSFAERYSLHGLDAGTRAFRLAESIGGLSNEISKLAGLGAENLYTLRDTASTSLLKMIESTQALDSALSNVLPRAHRQWLTDLERTVAPWLPVHDALWPRDAMVLQMLRVDEAVGVASWFSSSEMPELPPQLELGALSSQPTDQGRIDIELAVHCALCGGEIFSPSSKADWIGPRRMRMRTDVVPICRECNDREAREPGYIQAALRALLDEPRPAERVRFDVFDGDETDPVPRGRLTLVPEGPEPVDD